MRLVLDTLTFYIDGNRKTHPQPLPEGRGGRKKGKLGDTPKPSRAGEGLRPLARGGAGHLPLSWGGPKEARGPMYRCISFSLRLTLHGVSSTIMAERWQSGRMRPS